MFRCLLSVHDSSRRSGLCGADAVDFQLTVSSDVYTRYHFLLLMNVPIRPILLGEMFAFQLSCSSADPACFEASPKKLPQRVEIQSQLQEPLVRAESVHRLLFAHALRGA